MNVIKGHSFIVPYNYKTQAIKARSYLLLTETFDIQ